jgi:hypothetical protein
LYAVLRDLQAGAISDDEAIEPDSPGLSGKILDR